MRIESDFPVSMIIFAQRNHVIYALDYRADPLHLLSTTELSIIGQRTLERFL